MPLYEFRAQQCGCDYCRDGFELLLKLDQAKPEQCPQCAAPVAQVISAPYVQASHNIEKHGFTQYRKAGGGVYEKTAGKGPNFISDDGK